MLNRFLLLLFGYWAYANQEQHCGNTGIKFTVLINVYSRQHDLAPWLQQYLPHKCIVSIVLQTKNGLIPNITDIGLKTGMDVSHVTVVPSLRNSLNDRFLPLEEVQTDAVLVVDDDLLWMPGPSPHAFRLNEENAEGHESPSRREGPLFRVPGSRLSPHFHDLFQHYIHHPSDRGRLIGFSRRGAVQSSLGPFLQYTLPLESCSRFHMVLTNCALMPTSMLSAYWADTPRMAGARELVDRWLNCEDILMNFVAANATGLPPLAVGTEGQCQELTDVSSLRPSFPEGVFGPSSSLSSRPEHFRQRTECLNFFAQQIFDHDLPHALPEGGVTVPASPVTSVLANDDGSIEEEASQSRCPVSGFDHRRTAALAEHLLNSNPENKAPAKACAEATRAMGPVVEGRMREVGLLPLDPPDL